VLIARELGRLLHDPAALLAIVVAPFLLAVITSVSLGARPKIAAKIGAAGPDGLVTAMIDAKARVVHDVDGSDITLQRIRANQASTELADGRIAAALVISDRTRDPVRVLGAKNEPLAREVAMSIARTIRMKRVPLLVCRGLRKSFGARVAVNDVSFEISPPGLRLTRSERCREDDIDPDDLRPLAVRRR
jgi:hypothetical protein